MCFSIDMRRGWLQASGRSSLWVWLIAGRAFSLRCALRSAGHQASLIPGCTYIGAQLILSYANGRFILLLSSGSTFAHLGAQALAVADALSCWAFVRGSYGRIRLPGGSEPALDIDPPWVTAINAVRLRLCRLLFCVFNLLATIVAGRVCEHSVTAS